jgi:Tol biopolymer transport system component
MSLLLTRQSGGQTWNVSLVDDTTREETPLRPLQNLTDVPHLFWSGDGERLLAFAPARNITPLLLIDIDTQHTDYLTAFPPGTTYGSPSFSSGGAWLSLILHPPAPPSVLYIVNTTTGQVQLVRQNVPGTAIVGFRPHTN